MADEPDGAGRFVSLTLRPRVPVAAGLDAERAAALRHRAHKICFIARWMNFPVGQP